jgi:PPK2 family polyphosphate:nucleotide phosphotransferase
MDKYRVKPDARVKLVEWDPNDHEGDKGDAEHEIQTLTHQLSVLQELLYAEHRHKMLVVLQAMDTAGKDGTIAHVFQGVNPQGVRVASFKAPTPLERDHDFLWREHIQTPGNGEIVIFNRSHYEGVLVERVHDLVPQAVWEERYAEINDFEQMLANEGTTIVKFYLNIDEEEQKKRLQARLDDPQKRWKFNADDLKERALWSEYMRAYEDMLSRTSSVVAPWYIVPANHKWYRNLVVSRIIDKTLTDLRMSYPKPAFDASKIEIK